MNERFVVLEGVVGSDAQGLSIHRHANGAQTRYLAYIGLRDGSRLNWQEIELSQEQAAQAASVLASGNWVRVSGLLKKHLGLPLFRVCVESVRLLRAAEPLPKSLAA